MKSIRLLAAATTVALAAGGLIATTPAGAATAPPCGMLKDYVKKPGVFKMTNRPKRKSVTFTRDQQPGYVLAHQCRKGGKRVAALYIPQAQGDPQRKVLMENVINMAVIELPYGGFQVAYLLDDYTAPPTTTTTPPPSSTTTTTTAPPSGSTTTTTTTAPPASSTTTTTTTAPPASSTTTTTAPPADSLQLVVVSYALDGTVIARSEPIDVARRRINGMKIKEFYDATCGSFSTKTHVRQHDLIPAPHGILLATDDIPVVKLANACLPASE